MAEETVMTTMMLNGWLGFQVKCATVTFALPMARVSITAGFRKCLFLSARDHREIPSSVWGCR
jgi:hypothetical protein